MPEGTAIAAAGEAPARRRILRAELGATVKLALPMALTQLGQTAMLTTDVLLVGRLVYEKGFQLALDALPGVIEQVGEVRFLVAGSGTHEHELRAQAERLGLLEHGTFLGWIGDDVLHSLYRIADLCVVPSIYEPFGLVALEAMASGCPCIVADTGGLREVVPVGERVGLRFNGGDAQHLGVMIERLLVDDALRDRLVTEASEHVLSFDWYDVAQRTRGIYDELARLAPREGAGRG